MPTQDDALQPYHPIDCGFHDLLEALALRRQSCEIVAVAAEGHVRWITDRIVDVFAEGSEEFVRLENGERIRLDRLLVVAGQRRPGTSG